MNIRVADEWGSGEFGAPRDGGKRIHNGIDIAAAPGECVALSLAAGTVTKIGWAYKDDPHTRYVQVTDDEGVHYRSFYVAPCVNVGDKVRLFDPLGDIQAEILERKYPGIPTHVHFEIKVNGKHVDPLEWLRKRKQPEWRDEPPDEEGKWWWLSNKCLLLVEIDSFYGNYWASYKMNGIQYQYKVQSLGGKWTRLKTPALPKG